MFLINCRLYVISRVGAMHSMHYFAVSIRGISRFLIFGFKFAENILNFGFKCILILEFFFHFYQRCLILFFSVSSVTGRKNLFYAFVYILKMPVTSIFCPCILD